MKIDSIFSGIFLLFTLLLICLLFLPMSVAQMDELGLEAWLTEHPLVSEAIRWEDANGIRTYSNWFANQKAELLMMYRKILNGEPIDLIDPPPNIANPADNEFVVTVLSKEHAWQLFLAHVAYSLAVETESWVPWSLTEFSEETLLEIFDGSIMFRWDIGFGGYQLQHIGIPAPPDFTFEFLKQNDIIGQNRLHTIGNLLDWCRSNMIHFSGPFETKNMQGHWQYRGLVPISRVISGTMRYDNYFKSEMFGHYTAGCWGTTAFLRAVLRVVNIPVKETIADGHSLPYFMSEGKYLSHGDDPYNQNSRNMDHPPPFSIEELFIDQGTYDAWFGPGVPSKRNNVGRRVNELTIEYLPRATLKHHCQDIANGKSHADSYVYNEWMRLDRIYSVAELEAMNFWDRMDAKIDRLGGCAILNPQGVEPFLPDPIKISEIMVTSSGGRLPQWIELHNYSSAYALNLKGWTLEIQNRRSGDFDGNLSVMLTFKEKSIKPRKTLLIVAKQGRFSNNLPDKQIYNLSTLHPNLHNTLLNEEGFYMKLSNVAGELIDEVGNLDGKRNTNDKPAWHLPERLTETGARASMIRRHDQARPRLGTQETGWISAINTKLTTGTTTYYGHAHDIGSPGVELGGALPVQLSHFRAELTDAGVIITWATESELNNGGFYILRSETKNGKFKVVNPQLIQGAGTTSERHTYMWTDTTAKPNVVYYYRIADVSHSGDRKQLATVRMRGLVSASDKLTTRWADLKANN